MEEKHDTSRNIIIAIIVIAIIAVLGYFIYNSTLDNDEEAITNEVEDMVDDNDNNNEFDEVGAYSGMETYGDEEATGTIELVLADDGTATLVLAYDETSEYTGTYNKNGDSITFTADTEEETDTNNSVIDDATNDNDTTTGDDTTGTTNESTSNTTFNFRIDNDTLYYTSKETNEEVMLDKVERNTLQYIEE